MGLTHSEVCSGPQPPPAHCQSWPHTVNGTRVWAAGPLVQATGASGED